MVGKLNWSGRLLLLAGVGGITIGVVITLYALLTHLLSYLLYLGDPLETIPKLPWWYLYLVPTLSIILVNLIIQKYPSTREIKKDYYHWKYSGILEIFNTLNLPSVCPIIPNSLNLRSFRERVSGLILRIEAIWCCFSFSKSSGFS